MPACIAAGFWGRRLGTALLCGLAVGRCLRLSVCWPGESGRYLSVLWMGESCLRLSACRLGESGLRLTVFRPGNVGLCLSGRGPGEVRLRLCLILSWCSAVLVIAAAAPAAVILIKVHGDRVPFFEAGGQSGFFPMRGPKSVVYVSKSCLFSGGRVFRT